MPPRNAATINVITFSADWRAGFLIAEICQRHTISTDQAVRFRVACGLPPRNSRKERRRGAAPQVPTLEEIQSRAAAIRAGWDSETEAKRRVGTFRPYEIPLNVETPPDFDPQWYD